MAAAKKVAQEEEMFLGEVRRQLDMEGAAREARRRETEGGRACENSCENGCSKTHDAELPVFVTAFQFLFGL